MFRALIVGLAVAIFATCPVAIKTGHAASSSYATAKKKPPPKHNTSKKQNFAPSRCSLAHIDWGDYIRCGYDYPPWALGWDSFKRAQSKAKARN
jgi:hypothetical protein